MASCALIHEALLWSYRKHLAQLLSQYRYNRLPAFNDTATIVWNAGFILSENWHSEYLLGNCSDEVRAELDSVEDLEQTLEELVRRSTEQWPAFSISTEKYLRVLADSLHASNVVPSQHISKVVAEDLFLALACSENIQGSVEALYELTLGPLQRALRRLGATSATRDEVVQRVYDSILVGDGAQIRRYTARGPLQSWVRTIGIRTCRRLMGVEKRDAGKGENLEQIAQDPNNLEMAYLKAQYIEQFHAAFRQAVSVLEDRQRTILRQQHIDGLSVDALATLYKVHRATAARWAANARRILLDETRTILIASLSINSDEVDSIIRLVRSRIDISIQSFLK